MKKWGLCLGLSWLVYLVILMFGAGDVLSGNLPDNDDAMRLLQVRDLLAGAPWYDVSQPRLATPEGGAMHWSRMPDLGIAGLFLIADVFVSEAKAESFALLAWPLVLSFGVAYMGFRLLRTLSVGAGVSLLAMILLTQTYTFVQFLPGRIDHHGLQVLLLAVVLGGLLGDGRRSAAVAGAALGLMVAIAVEALPVVVGCLIAAGLMWIFARGMHAKRLSAFGAAILVVSLAAFALDAPGLNMSARAVCDAYGVGHLAALGVAGAGFICIGLFGQLDTKAWPVRFCVMAVVGGLAALAGLGLAPECLADPYASLPADVRERWLSMVGEAMPLLAKGPAFVITHFPGLILGLAGAVWLVLTSQGKQQTGWAVLFLLLVITSLASLWQTRGLTFASLIVILISAGLIARTFTAWREQGGAKPLIVFAATFLMFSPLTWATIGASQAAPSQDTVQPDTCHSRETLRQILPNDTMTILSTIDAGAPILLHTPHEVLAAPYHRNVKGLSLVIRVFSGPLDAAETLVRTSGADAIYVCPGVTAEDRLYARWAPNGLSARLQEGAPPAWLYLEAEYANGAQLYRLSPLPEDQP